MIEDRALKLVVVLAKAYKSYIGEVSSNLKTLGFSDSEFGALEYLYNRTKKVSAQELAKKILLTSGTTTYTIDKLVKRGYIIKEENSLDKRFIELSLTDEGNEIMKNLFPEHVKFLGNLNPLTEDESDTLIELLKKLGKTIR